jgi:hypothetical protein
MLSDVITDLHPLQALFDAKVKRNLKQALEEKKPTYESKLFADSLLTDLKIRN